MKKIIILAFAVISLMGCSKVYSNGTTYDVIGDQENRNDYNAKAYFTAISNVMVTDAINELESAIKVETLVGGTSSRFDTSAGSIFKEGVEWTVVGLNRALYGMKIKNIGSESWELTYEGIYSLNGNFYPVYFIIKAKMGSNIVDNHYNWAITLNGNRSERGGYSCTFKTNDTVLYQCKDGNTNGWNYLNGTFLLTVFKESNTVDLWTLVFDGNPSQGKFTRSL